MKLARKDQISHLKTKDIKFNFISEDAAYEILEKNSYYYKLTCYKRNFRKTSSNKYVDLDFAHLYDLSIIDMRMRQLFNKLCLDIEHSLKKSLINDITDSTEDGYSIVTEFDNYERKKFNQHQLVLQKRYGSKYIPKFYNDILSRTIFKVHDSNDYEYQLSSKYFKKSRVPAWVLIEKLSFGQLVAFIEFYVTSHKNNYLYYKNANELLIMIKRIRNASSHNRPIIMNISNKIHSGSLTVSSNVKGYLTSLNISSPSNRKEHSQYIALLEHTKIHDIFCLVILYKEYINSEKMVYSRRKEIKSFLCRAKLNSKYYYNHKKLKNIFKFLEKSLNTI